MKQLFALTLTLLFVECSSKPKIEIPSSVNATYWMARQQGRWYNENLKDLINLDSEGVSKLSYDSLESLDVKYRFNSNQVDNANKEVTDLEKLHPEYSDADIAINYVKFCLDSLYPNREHNHRIISYASPIMMEKFTKEHKK